MWKDYSRSYIRHNRASGISVMAAAFISSLLLSLLCGLFYNLWKYELEKLLPEEESLASASRELLFSLTPRTGFWLYMGIFFLACVSLVLIIHNSFAVSMNARVHQFGIFSSIGATPRQIRVCLRQEAIALCAGPVVLGDLLGIFLGREIIVLTNVLAGDIRGRRDAVWGYHPAVFFFTLAATALTVWISAEIPARKLGRLTPLEAIKNTGEPGTGKRKSSPVLARLFGMEGELAGNALRAQRRALRTSTVSLVSSFLAFTLMVCFFTLTGLSQDMTYFERYEHVWDVMLTVKGAEIASFDVNELENLSGVENCTIYQKAGTRRMIRPEELSDADTVEAWFANASDESVTPTKDGWLVSAPLVILDDESFLEYCRQIGTEPKLSGAIVLNRIRDVNNPDFRHPSYMPYVKEEGISRLLAADESEIPLTVLSCTQEVPPLREEYGTEDYYELVHFLPVSLWRTVEKGLEKAEPELYVRFLAEGDPSLAELNALQTEAEKIAGQSYEVVSENRIADKMTNDRMIRGMMLILGGFCVLLAVIGLANVFSNTLGAVRQRRRELARYMSVGLTPGGIRKLFFIEAMVIAGRPALVTLPLAAAAVGLLLKASYLELAVFLKAVPAVPVLAFLLGIFLFVGLAYYLGYRQIRKINLAEALRDDTLC